jgi:hypothetical protein
MVNFYRRFLPKSAQILKPSADLLKGGAKTLEWTVSAQEAFQNAKSLLAAVPLQHPAPNAELSLATDASNTHIGGVMQQKSGDHWRPLGFFSRKLTDTESHYSTFDRELLAAHAAIKHGFCAAAPLLHLQSRVMGRGGCRQPPQGLHGCGRHSWQPVSPRQTTGFAPRQSCCNQAGLVFRPAGFFTFISGAATRRSRNRFPTRRGGFCTPGTGGAFTGATDTVPVPSTGTAM